MGNSFTTFVELESIFIHNMDYNNELNGNVHVWILDGQQLIKTFKVCEVPVRTAKFIARKNWVVIINVICLYKFIARKNWVVIINVICLIKQYFYLLCKLLYT